MISRTVLAGISWMIALVIAPLRADAAQTADPVAEEGVLPAQARRGEAVFRDRCAVCHSVAQFRTPSFTEAWAGRSVFELFDEIRTSMPQNAPGQLAAEEYVDLVAYLLMLNGHVASEAPLPVDEGVLRRVRVRWAKSSSSDVVVGRRPRL